MGDLVTDSDRRELLATIEQRKAQLKEKRELLERLRGVSGTSGSSLTAGLPTAENLLNKALTAINEATSTAVIEDGPGTSTGVVVGSTNEAAVAGPPQNLRYSRTLRRVIGALKEVSGTVDVTIGPSVLDHLDKSIQCDKVFEDHFSPRVIEDHIGDELGGGEETTTSPVSHHHNTISPMAAIPPSSPQVPITAIPHNNKILQQQQYVTQTPTQAAPPPPPPPPLSDGDKARLLHDPHFDEFLENASRIVERTLGEVSFYEGYSSAVEAGVEGDDESNGEKIRPMGRFKDESWSIGRPVSSIAVHPKFPATMLASYGPKQHPSPIDTEGCVLIWNLAMSDRPEFSLSSQSSVCCGIFDPYRPHIIIGGTSTGSISLWDTRTSSLRPQQKTPLSESSHHHPVYCLSIVGSENAHNLISIDRDGRCCVWSLAMLSQPTEYTDLKNHGKDVRPSCFTYCESAESLRSVNKYLLGCDDGAISIANLLHGTSRNGTTDVINNAHSSPISDIHWHPQHQQLDTSNQLFLSSSFDWTVKLWNIKNLKSPLHTFDAFEDYVSTVQWHPKNPSVFAAGQVNGVIRVWNMVKGLDIPVSTCTTGGTSTGTSTTTDEALTKLRWFPDGDKFIVGDCSGTLSLWGITSSIATPENIIRWEGMATELRPGGQRLIDLKNYGL